jgi:uncharacterized heparinase superfamily protein
MNRMGKLPTDGAAWPTTAAEFTAATGLTGSWSTVWVCDEMSGDLAAPPAHLCVTCGQPIVSGQQAVAMAQRDPPAFAMWHADCDGPAIG